MSRPIGMREMNVVFEVVDRFDLSREAIQVELLPAGDGDLRRLDSGRVAVVLPEDLPIEAWPEWLERGLRRVGAVMDEQPGGGEPSDDA